MITEAGLVLQRRRDAGRFACHLARLRVLRHETSPGDFSNGLGCGAYRINNWSRSQLISALSTLNASTLELFQVPHPRLLPQFALGDAYSPQTAAPLVRHEQHLVEGHLSIGAAARRSQLP